MTRLGILGLSVSLVFTTACDPAVTPETISKPPIASAAILAGALNVWRLMNLKAALPERPADKPPRNISQMK